MNQARNRKSPHLLRIPSSAERPPRVQSRYDRDGGGPSADCAILLRWSPEVFGANGTDCCSVRGVHCDGDGRVLVIKRHGSGFTTPLTSEFARMDKLQMIDFYSNAITGSIPTELGLLAPTLSYLGLDYNQLTGSIPSQLGLLTKLTYLGFGVNHMVGTVPTELGAITDLRYLFIGTNNFSGSLPSELENLKLERFHLDRNVFTGDIPDYFPRINETLIDYNCFANQRANRSRLCDYPAQLLGIVDVGSSGLSVGAGVGIGLAVVVAVCAIALAMFLQRRTRMENDKVSNPATPPDSPVNLEALAEAGFLTTTGLLEAQDPVESTQLAPPAPAASSFGTTDYDSATILNAAAMVPVPEKGSALLSELVDISAEPASWTIDQTAAWGLRIDGIGSILFRTFRENDITGDLLLDLSREDIVADLGLDNEQATLLEREIAKLRVQPPEYDASDRGEDAGPSSSSSSSDDKKEERE